MAEPFVGEISIVAFDFAPPNWAFCDGATVPRSQYGSLFSLLGTTFGGAGTEFFMLPDMRGLVPFGASSSYPMGVMYGQEQAYITEEGMPSYSHTFYGMNVSGTKNGPGKTGNALLANDDDTNFFASSATNIVQMRPDSVGGVGNGAAHNNIQPSIALNFIIALTGVPPTTQ
ncbi:MAG: tail fiber protein [Victivallales bacterium]